jgi:hypothetical protein
MSRRYNRKFWEKIISSPNIVTNEEEVDEYEIFNESNCVPFVGQIFPNEEEAFAIYKRYAYQQGFAVKKGRFIKKMELLAGVIYFVIVKVKSPWKS